MDDKKAATILLRLLKKPNLDKEEKEALQIAIGVLSWTSLAQSKLKRRKSS